MKKLAVAGILLCLLLLLCFGASAAELVVGAQEGYQTLTEAVQVAQANDTIRIMAGTYAGEGYPIEIDKPLTITGEAGTVLAGKPYLAMFRVTAHDVTIQNITLQLLRWGIVCDSDRLQLLHCTFLLADDQYRVSSCGVWLADAQHCTILDCAFKGCGVCMAGPEINERSKGKAVLTGLFEVGENTDCFTTHTLRGNTVNGKPLYYYANEDYVVVPEEAGSVIAACCDCISAVNIDVSDSSIGLALIHCAKTHVERVRADRCGIFGVYLAYVSQGIVKDVVSTQSNHGIDLRAVEALTVTGCSTPYCEQGIFFAFARDCYVQDCEVLHCGNGFFLASGSRNQICDSTVKGNENGIYVQGDQHILLCSNNIQENSVAGIRFLRSSGQLIHNTICTNRTGLMVIESDNTTIAQQIIMGNLSCGLYLCDTSASQIIGNDFSGDSGNAVETEGTMTNVCFVQNKASRDLNTVWKHTGDIWFVQGDGAAE